MKLRLFKDSLRLRLSKDDVAELMLRGCVQLETHLAPGAKLGYALRLSDEVKTPQATLIANVICVDMPRALARRWSAGEDVAVRAVQDAGEQRSLDILIEKDFECLDPRGNEPGENLYPNPRLASPGGESGK